MDRQVVIPHLALLRRQRFEIRKQVAHVFELHLLVRRVGKDRIVMAAVGRRALPHGGDEVRLAPGADAVFRIGRDVGRIERAEVRLKGRAAAEPGLVLLVGRRVAGGAAAGVEHGLAVAEIGRVGAERARGYGRRHGDEPEYRGTDRREDHRQDQELAQHRNASLVLFDTASIAGATRRPSNDEGRPVMPTAAPDRVSKRVMTPACGRAGGSRRNSCAPRSSAP